MKQSTIRDAQEPGKETEKIFPAVTAENSLLEASQQCPCPQPQRWLHLGSGQSRGFPSLGLVAQSGLSLPLPAYFPVLPNVNCKILSRLLSQDTGRVLANPVPTPSLRPSFSAMPGLCPPPPGSLVLLPPLFIHYLVSGILPRPTQAIRDLT